MAVLQETRVSEANDESVSQKTWPIQIPRKCRPHLLVKLEAKRWRLRDEELN